MTIRSEKTGRLGTESFRALIERRSANGFFQPGVPIAIARAPGRLDLMGGIADYSGSTVLQFPISEASFAAAQVTGESSVMIESIADRDRLRSYSFRIASDELRLGGKIGSTADARRYFSGRGDDRWAAYAAGAIVVLIEATQTRFPSGFRLLIYSNVPLGKGVSSSAALEVSAMKAVVDALAAAGLGPPDLACRDIALLCQRVENEVVGAPCGVMDQMVSACGSENELLEILCQPAQLLGTLPLPEGIELWGIDSGIRHSIAGAHYATVRTAAAMGYRMLAQIAGLSIRNAGPSRVDIFDGKWDGYLANIDPEMFSGTLADELPDTARGRDFITTFYGVSDPFAVIDPDAFYPVRAATAHPIFENARVRRFGEILRDAGPDLHELGSLMYASHESYSACGLGSDGTDLLVKLVREQGPRSGLFGAKITGGGSGGTVAVLGRRGSDDVVRRVASKYEELTGRRSQIFSGSSPGAFRFGGETFSF